MTSAPAREDLYKLVAQAVRRWESMTSRQQANMLWYQRVSWTYGNLAIDNPSITYKQVYDAAVRDFGPPPGDEDAQDL